MKGTDGISMLPAIWPGARIETCNKKIEDICVGDVVCYPGDSSTMVAHRVVAIEAASDQRIFITRGDAQTKTDRIEEEAVCGVVDRVIYPVGYYETSGIVGRFFARYAVSDAIHWRVARACTLRVLRLVVRQLRHLN